MFGQTKQLRARVDHLQRQVRDLEGLVTRLAERADVGPAELREMLADVDPGLTPEVVELIADGQPIAAIKAYREATGADLKEARDAVEAYHHRHP